MSAYVRPAIDDVEFLDAEGKVINYGERWGADSPPENTYSVDSHPERFAPLHTIADALIAHLVETFDVDVAEDVAFGDDLLNPMAGVVRAVRVTPRDAACARLTFVFTSYPSVVIAAGLLHDFHAPSCGCDACDDTWESVAEVLENVVAGVTSGGYRESVERGLKTWTEYSLEYPEGSESGRSLADSASKARVNAAKEILKELPGGWAAWPTLASWTSCERDRTPI